MIAGAFFGRSGPVCGSCTAVFSYVCLSITRSTVNHSHVHAVHTHSSNAESHILISRQHQVFAQLPHV
jgi:hypothetical protein